MTHQTTIFVAREIITMNPMQAAATHVAVRDGRILGVGNLSQLAQWGDYTLDTRFADCTLMPGLIEGHCHLKEGGIWELEYLGWFDRRNPLGKTIQGLRSMESVVQRLIDIEHQMQQSGMPADKPLVAWGFDPIYFGGERMTIEHLDRVSLSRPIVIAHANGHLMNVNSPMLRIAEIDEDSEVEGVVKFNGGPRAGQPNGELQELAAMHLVFRHIGNVGLLSPVDEAGIMNFARLANMQGVTTATDMVNALGESECQVLESTLARDECCVRILPAFKAFHGAHGARQGAEHLNALKQRNSDKLRYGLVKMMLDGSIQGFSSRMRWPGHFNGAPNGIWVTAPSQYEADLEIYHRAGLHVHTHTNGDEASLVAIDAMERVLSRAPRADHRHTLQHAQMVDAALFRRMASLGMCVNLFANHLWYWGDQHYEITMGPDRAQGLDACASALAAGVPLAIHSDAPVTPLGPLFTAWCAANRITPKGRVLGENERLTVHQALHAITMGAAWTLKMDHEIGSIEVGKRADFCVLLDNPLALGAEKLKDARVWGTVLGGQIFPAQSD
ncbi:MAG: amidohydrolase [Limnohabitans sp.]